MALKAAAAPYTIVRASSWEPVTLPTLLKVNPLGQIPTLVWDDGTIQTESAAILISLGLAYPRSGLLPRSEAAQRSAIRGLVFIAANCYAAVSVIDLPQRWTASKTRVARGRVQQAARAQLHSHWDVFVDVFAEHESLNPGSPGALAYLAVVASRWSGTRAHLKSSRSAFYQRLQRLERDTIISAVLGA